MTTIHGKSGAKIRKKIVRERRLLFTGLQNSILPCGNSIYMD